MPRMGRPSESRVAPVPMVGFGLVPVRQSVALIVQGCSPSDSILLVLCEPPIVMSHPNCGRSMIAPPRVASMPELRTEPRLRVTLGAVWSPVDDAPDDAAIG